MDLDSSGASCGLFTQLHMLPTEINQFSFCFHFRKINPLGQAGSWCPAGSHVLPIPALVGCKWDSESLGPTTLCPCLAGGRCCSTASLAAWDRQQDTARRLLSLLPLSCLGSSPMPWVTLSLSPHVLQPLTAASWSSRSSQASFPCCSPLSPGAEPSPSAHSSSVLAALGITCLCSRRDHQTFSQNKKKKLNGPPTVPSSCPGKLCWDSGELASS